MMKINKSLILISLILIFCVSLGAVSAADIDVNDVDNNVATVESSIDLDDEINVVNEGEIHNSSEIADEIRTATGTYDILYDYQIDTTWAIKGNNLIIEGNNHTIYGEGNHAIYVEGENVTIQNLNFINCSAIWGGAIEWKAYNGVVSGCSFVNCDADSGGAIYWDMDNVVVSGCSFVNCSAGYGGAIRSYGYESAVTGCSFVNCSGDNNGGAIGISGYVNVSECNFTDCSAYCGGAIWCKDSLYLDVVDCSFVNCSTYSYFDCYGGAIWCEDAYLTVENCSFVDCSAYDGGAIYSDYTIVVDCSFVNCSAVSGGAICSDYLDITNCSFVNCSAVSGGAIWSEYLNVVDCGFVECNASIGGAIYTQGNSVINSTFDNCSAIDQYAGAIYSEGTMNVKDCNFTNCIGGMYAGAIGVLNGILTVDNCNFANCSSLQSGGAIVSYDMNGMGSLTVNDCNFIDCSAVYSGGAITSSSSTTINNSSFIDCSAKTYDPEDESYYGNGGAIAFEYLGITSLNINDCNFVNCSSCGGIILSLISNVQGCNFINCSSDEEGIITTSGGSINYNIFDNNKGTLIYWEADDYIPSYIPSVDVKYNFFAFQNNLTEFPDNLIIKHIWYDVNDTEENKSVTPENWVVLNISSGKGCYFVEFVLNDGSALDKFMPDYDVDLTINGDNKNIVVSKNTFNNTIDVGEFLAKSPNSGNVLVNTTIGPGPVEDYSIKTWDCEYGDTAKVLVVVPDYVTGNISVNVNGQILTGEIEDGIAIVLINGLNPGTYVLNISYSGDKYSLPFNDTANLTVSEPPITPMNISDVVSGNDVVVDVTLPSDAKGYVEFYLNDEYCGDAGVRNGSAKFNFTSLDDGNYTIKAIYSGDNKYLPANVTTNIFIGKLATSLSGDNLSISAYSSNNLVVTLKDAKGNLLAGKNLTILLGGKTYNVVTDSKGQAKLAVASSYVKNYTADIKFAGDDNYLESSTSVKITVNPAYVTVADIIKAANTLKLASYKNKALPATIQVGSYKLTNAQLSYLMAAAIKNIKAGKSVNTKVKVINVKATNYNPKVSVKVTQANYLSIVNTIYSNGAKGTLPKYVTAGGKTIGYDVYTYTLARILSVYNSAKQLPSYCLFENY